MEAVVVPEKKIKVKLLTKKTLIKDMEEEKDLTNTMTIPILALNTETDVKVEPEKKLYNLIISEIKTIAEKIEINKTGETVKNDGRMTSLLKEQPFLDELKRILLERNPKWEINISPPRASYDFSVNGILFNLKLTDCKTADNSLNKSCIYYSITGLTDYPYSSNWNNFIDYILKAKNNNKIKKIRNKSTEYHYLVKNKINGEVLVKPIFDIYEYISNPSNILQINWKKEYLNKEYYCKDDDYLKKVIELVKCIQKSVKENYENSKKLIETNFSELLG